MALDCISAPNTWPFTNLPEMRLKSKQIFLTLRQFFLFLGTRWKSRVQECSAYPLSSDNQGGWWSRRGEINRNNEPIYLQVCDCWGIYFCNDNLKVVELHRVNVGTPFYTEDEEGSFYFPFLLVRSLWILWIFKFLVVNSYVIWGG